jgi:hypothetical protein
MREKRLWWYASARNDIIFISAILSYLESIAMTAENFENALISFRDQKPFHPFTVELIGGERFEVDYPGALLIRDGVAVYIKAGGRFVSFDHDSVLQFISGLKQKRKSGGHS